MTRRRGGGAQYCLVSRARPAERLQSSSSEEEESAEAKLAEASASSTTRGTSPVEEAERLVIPRPGVEESEQAGRPRAWVYVESLRKFGTSAECKGALHMRTLVRRWNLKMEYSLMRSQCNEI
ncbi:hypothetical protein AB1Y20_016254 [Prymnesium parvum]|uniref:Uncharacterized protein n=1 Tax=Prymnesium parvum TaxID=97485 RepID=A0AB34IDE6_PRYPA